MLTTQTTAELAGQILPATFLSPLALQERGISRHQSATLVAAGRLRRIRNGCYVPADLEPALIRAGELGGRLDCVSLLRVLGVFVRESHGLHVQITPGSTRLPPRPAAVVAHWRPSARRREFLSVDIVEALVQACRCQSVRDAIATLDSAWHQGLVDESGVAEIFRRLPRRLRRLRALLDPRSESGPETLVRLMLRLLGAHVEVQVQISGVGRVDFVVDGWLIIECDSRAHHEGWQQQKRDRRRDLAAAALGYTTIRPIAEDILSRPDEVNATLVDVLSDAPMVHRSPLQNSARIRRQSSHSRQKRSESAESVEFCER